MTTPVTGLIQVDQDTYSPIGLCWDHASVRTVDLLGNHRRTNVDQPAT